MEEQPIISIKRFLSNTQKELEKIGQFFQVSIHFHPSHLRPNILNTSLSFGELVGLLPTKLNHYFTVSIDINVYSVHQIDTKIGDTALLTDLT